ncbi:MAG: FkbM family methyltransferase [Proteobacteria bacterium]|nr:FkbM family methyltransferase [Pseudomonadota bacterium]
MTFVSYAQNFEDVLLWRALKRVTNGFYIDVGAGHPDIDSVTRAFYDHGWSGINIEPVAEYSLRLAAARPRDINLRIALGERAGHADLFIVDGTGLSTVEKTGLASIRDAGLNFRAADVERDTLASICRRHAPETIHFLKIDVEGAERAVLLGADFASFRPWIIVVEATAPMSLVEVHGSWESILLDAEYRFVWFDGLNRFYLSTEMHDELRGAFDTPANVFDDFIRVADTNLAARIQAAETRAAMLHEQILPAERRAAEALERARAAEQCVAAASMAAADARIRADDMAREAARMRGRLRAEVLRREAAEREAEAQERRAEYEGQRAAIFEQRERNALTTVDALFNSTSWRVTAPLRRLRARGQPAPPRITTQPYGDEVSLADASATPGADADAEMPARVVARSLIQTIHQFHAGSAIGDAITNSMLLTRARLRALGYRSDIFVCVRDPELEHELRPFEELPRHDDYVLIVRHSMGFGAFEPVAALAAPKVLLYHNITPVEFLPDNEHLARYSVLGRKQLQKWRDLVTSALADSEYNALELRSVGYEGVQVCNTLLDIDALLVAAQARPRRRDPRRLTILFVGRVIESKGQTELVEVFADFRKRYGRPCRLVIVGRHGGDQDAYYAAVRTRVHAYGISDDVTLAGLVSDDALYDWYSAADIYLSLSHHEGFAVPLVEAMVHDLPVLARPAAAVPYTIRGTGGLIDDDSHEGMVSRLLTLAEDEAERGRLVARQRAVLEQFRWRHHESTFLQALTRAGAASPIASERRSLLAEMMRFTITGHISGSYSLASVNRRIALELEASHPGSVRVEPIDNGEPSTVISGMTQVERAAIARLVERRRPLSGPQVFISQYYPVHVVREPNDLALAYVFWEESLLPPETVATLNRNFQGVLAPTRFVAKALIDSGVSIPVRVVGFAPDLDPYRELGRSRTPSPGRAFHFLHVSSGFPRKGIDVLLEAYVRAFRGRDLVTLTIKVFPNIHNTVAEQIEILRKNDPDMPEVRLIDDDIDEQAMIALYRDADVAVLPTRGEGYNLPAAEALAAGLPLIVTGFSGHLDFCGESVRLLDYRFAASGSHLAMPGSLWVEPDVDDLVRALKEVVEQRIPALPPHVLQPGDMTQAILDAALDLLLKPPSRSRPRIGWVSSWEVRCGIAEYSRHLVEGIIATGSVASVAVFSDSREPVERRPLPDVTAERCWDLGTRDTSDLTFSIGRSDPDVLVIQHQPGLLPWLTLAALLGTLCVAERPTVVVLHSTKRLLDVDEEEGSLVVAALSRVSRIVVHTLDDLNRLKRLGLVENVTMMFQGAPPPPDLPPATEPEEDKPFVVGCYGFLLPTKGIPELIEAVAALQRQNRKIRLCLVNADYGTGDSAVEMARCRQIANRTGITHAIDWHTDFMSDERSRALLRQCHLVVLPYQESKEGSSAALRMALSAGRPVAVTPLTFFDEAGAAVSRLEGTDSSAIARGIAALLDNPQDRQVLSEKARVWLKEREWPLIATRFSGMLRGLQVSPSPLRSMSPSPAR